MWKDEKKISKACTGRILRISILIAVTALLMAGEAGIQGGHPTAAPPARSHPQDFTFAHLTDAHIGYFSFRSARDMRESVENFADTLQDVKSTGPDFVLITGDSVEYDKRDFFTAFRNIIRSSSIPVKGIVPGNHDRRDVLGMLGDNLSNYNERIKPVSESALTGSDYFFDFGGYRFIGMDSGADYNASEISSITESMVLSVSCPPLVCDYMPESKGLSSEQMERLRGEFNTTAPKIVFMHHPVISSGMDYSPDVSAVPQDGGPGGNDGSISFNRWDFINYTKDSSVQLVLTGHSHSDAVFNITGDAVENSSLDRPLFIQTRSATRNEDYGRGYRIIEVKGGKVNPLRSTPTPRFERTTVAMQFNSSGWYGLHTYDYQGRHTGMNQDCSDIELGIPDSYYTGDYGGFTSTPQVVVSYSGIKNVSVSRCSNSINPEDNAQPPRTYTDMIISYQTEKSEGEVNLNSTTAPFTDVNVSDVLNGYTTAEGNRRQWDEG